MKNCILSVFCIAAMFAQGASISDVIVRQQWPWSTDIKVEYKLSGVTAPVDVTLEAFNGGRLLDSSNFSKAIRGSSSSSI